MGVRSGGGATAEHEHQRIAGLGRIGAHKLKRDGIAGRRTVGHGQAKVIGTAVTKSATAALCSCSLSWSTTR